MSTTPFQPTLPAETTFSEAELSYVDDSPTNLYPENQNSNYGLLRKIWTDKTQELIDQLSLLYDERFADTSSTFLDVWEAETGLPVAPQGATVEQRRGNILNRLVKLPFTRARRAAIVESFIVATFGNPVVFTVDGIPITPAGIPLYSEGAAVTSLYTIIENVSGFSYTVRIKNTITPDLAGLNRELARITPAGISFTVTLVAVP